jgi:hypothetical protein
MRKVLGIVGGAVAATFLIVGLSSAPASADVSQGCKDLAWAYVYHTSQGNYGYAETLAGWLWDNNCL